MHTLNLVENTTVDFNAFRLLDTRDQKINNLKLALTEQLQTSLELNVLLNIFSLEAAKYANFSGLYFKHENASAAMRGSKAGKKERRYELKINNKYLGTLTYAINSPISVGNNKILKELHQLLLFPLHNAIKYQQAMLFALQDSLTGLGNRRYYDEQLKRAMHHANRQLSKVGLIICDLNKFKQINDTHGHKIGDDILVLFSKALNNSVRDSDSLFRFGGDEFVIIVEDASEKSLLVIENRINHNLSIDPILTKYQVGCSVGHTFMNRDDNEHSFFERADNMLYQRKHNNQPTLKIIEL